MTTFPLSESGELLTDTRATLQEDLYRRLMMNDRSQQHVVSSTAAQVLATNADTASSRPRVHDIAHARRRAVNLAARGTAEPPLDRVVGLQKWLGRVVSIADEAVELELDADAEGPSLIADFPLELFGEEAPLPGDVAYLTVRTVRGWRGQPSRTVSVRLRRLGRWTEQEVAEIRSVAARESKDLRARFD